MATGRPFLTGHFVGTCDGHTAYRVSLTEGCSRVHTAQPIDFASTSITFNVCKLNIIIHQYLNHSSKEKVLARSESRRFLTRPAKASGFADSSLPIV